MPTDRNAPRRIATSRSVQIAALHGEHARQLERRVARRARADPPTIEDACSFAWLQLLTHTAVDLASSSHGAIGWLEQTATREAWRLQARRARDELLELAAIERQSRLREQTVPGVHQLAAQRARVELVEQIPERPRRFLWRLALGYSHREITAAEDVSATTTNKQIARAKRLLRSLEAVDTTPSSTASMAAGGPLRATAPRSRPA